MLSIVVRVLYYFFVVMEFILFAYIISTWLPMKQKLRNILDSLVAPILDPIRFMMKRSILDTRMLDLTPLIAFIVIIFLQNFFRGFM